MTWILPERERLESPNQSRRVPSVPVDALVLHYAVDGDQSPDGDEEPSLNFATRERSHDCMDVARSFARPSRKASAHFVIGRDGSKVQCVPLDRTSWHAGKGALPREGAGPVEKPRRREMNRRSIGIELCSAGFAVEKLRVPTTQRVMAAHPARPRKRMEWETFSPQQIETLRYVVALVMMRHPELRFVVGHEDVVNRHTLGRIGGKVDPGPAFPWHAIEWGGLGLTRLRYDYDARGWTAVPRLVA